MTGSDGSGDGPDRSGDGSDGDSDDSSSDEASETSGSGSEHTVREQVRRDFSMESENGLEFGHKWTVATLNMVWYFEYRMYNDKKKCIFRLSSMKALLNFVVRKRWRPDRPPFARRGQQSDHP